VKASRAWVVLRKDLALGPRSPLLLYAVALPFVLTALVQLAFGSLLEPHPRLAIADEGSSSITAAAARTDGIDLTVLGSADEVVRAVEANDHDVGVVLPAGFDDDVRAGEQPLLEMYVSGSSHASNRVLLTVTVLDLVRAVDAEAPPVDVELVRSGEAALALSLRLVPVLVMYALFIAGAFVPASSLVDEKTHGTLTAVLVTPTRIGEVLAAKAALGVLLAFVMSVVTLGLNGVLGRRWPDLLVVVLLGAVFSALIGLVIGALAQDATMLFTIMKSSGILLFGPVIFYVFPDWPQWVARLFPTYWVIDPIWRVAVLGDGLLDVAGTLAVAVGIGAVLVLLVVRLSRRVLEQAVAAR
jgi:ABC-2 type transport system permease protein